MNIRAVLQTSRYMERGVQYYGPDVVTVSTMADKWLDNHGKPGDQFAIFEETLVRVVPFTKATVLVESEQVPGPTLQHAFVPGSGIHCDRCGGVHP